MNRYRVDVIKKSGREKIQEATFLYKTLDQMEKDLLYSSTIGAIKDRYIEIWNDDTFTLLGKFACIKFRWEVKLHNFINDLAIKSL